MYKICTHTYAYTPTYVHSVDDKKSCNAHNKEDARIPIV